MLKIAYGEDILNRIQVFVWFGRFKNGAQSDDDAERSGRPSTSTTSEFIQKV